MNTRTWMHTHVHTHTHIYTHLNMTLTQKHIHEHAYTYKHLYEQSCTHICTKIHIQTHIYMCTQKHTQPTYQINIHACSYRKICTQTNITLKYPSMSYETNGKIMNSCWQSSRFLILPWAFLIIIKKKKDADYLARCKVKMTLRCWQLHFFKWI